MRLPTFLAFTALLAASFSHAASRPNILFMMADDLNNALGCYGHPLVKTPNLDKLAARGVRFENAACQYPLCGPSRNSMLTGLYPNSTGILTNSQLFRQTIPKAISLPQAFRQDGYFAARIGKLYHYGVPNSIGTNGHDDPASWELELNPAGCDRLLEHPVIFSLTPGSFGGTLSWYASPRPDEQHTDGLQAKDAEWVLERCAREKDRPFFLALGFFRPHTPYVAPEKWFKGYPEAEMPFVQGVEEEIKDLPPLALASHKKEHELLTDDLRRQAVQAYFSSISFMDAQAGKVLDALDRLGLADNTIVVFTSDHGYHLGEHGLWQKMSIFEESARVPLIIAGPGTKKGGVAKAPAGLVDLYPTLAELCGVKAPANLQGQSLAPILKAPETAKGRGWVLSQVMRGGGGGGKGKGKAKKADAEPAPRVFGYSLRTDRWRYTEWDAGKQGKELYDHETDPKEHTNLADKAEHAAAQAKLAEQLQAAIASTFPPDGKIPEIPTGNVMYTPELVDP